MGKEFAAEIDYLPKAVAWALMQDVDLLRRIVGSHSGRSLLSVGSGGSSTAATFLALLHERKFRKVSRWITPVGMLAHDVRPDACAFVLISAEGKNRDVLTAAQHMLELEATGFAITLAPDSPLATRLRDAGATVASFEPPWGKDGYLATNSLLSTLILLARAYDVNALSSFFGAFDHRWLMQRRRHIADQGLSRAVEEGRQLCVLYGRDGATGATDIESKLAESAMGASQAVDYRQFAHGRHLQLTRAETAPCFVAFISERDAGLAQATIASFPAGVPVVRIELPADPALAEIVSVIDAILITDILSAAQGVDPGCPDVPEFGRLLHSLDLRGQIRAASRFPFAIERKVPSAAVTSAHELAFSDAGMEFCRLLERARFRALVCDFDGTFCNTDLRFDGLDSSLIAEIERLAGAGILIGFATGRGDSLHVDLRAKLHQSLWNRVIVGCYSGTIIETLDAPAPIQVSADLRLIELGEWLTSTGVIDTLGASPRICGAQMSLRLADHSSKMRAAAYARQWIAGQNHTGWRVVYSGHSIDIITEHAGKERVASAVAKIIGCDSGLAILRLGDSGDIEGNDFELLATGLGLSVASVSIAKDACWNFLPVGLTGVAGTRFYLHALEIDGDSVVFSRDFIAHVAASVTRMGQKR
ncbi:MULTISPECIES: hypothetical protein [Paraburkholderia]|uniref:hypothetical protein n=1 Tax=Paraburkholderia TaxID=1822464 RepID=UPI00190BBB49|nr:MULTISPECIES: hypothetical protein [Paraburkholderia]MBK3745040.1 hypothetical protein [Paraburkholderia aspalathi]MBK5186436.1 hypothetical protein [Burkholderia sp. R-69749]CAE6842020.1 hypothetical protein R69619_07056 [Paraburkholderia nemoris]CAE6905354.1 hypothetical protein R69749_08375 [Paraburkholderia domus]